MRLQRKRILILAVIFFATFPISYITTAFIPQFGVRISGVLIRFGVHWVTAAHIAYLLLTILTSLFFTFIAWLFLKAKEKQEHTSSTAKDTTTPYHNKNPRCNNGIAYLGQSFSFTTVLNSYCE